MRSPGLLRKLIFQDMKLHIEYDSARMDLAELEQLARHSKKSNPRPDIIQCLKSIKDRVPVIAEYKPASPERIFFIYRDPLETVAEMIQAGAAAISVLTEPIYYRGSLHHLAMISNQFQIPTLRKDLILSDHQVYEAAIAGASSYLLIANQFDSAQRLEHLIQLGRSLGMEPLVELNSVKDLELIAHTSAKFMGINNGEGSERDLNKTKQLAPQIQAEFLISESGIYDAQDVRFVMEYVDGILVGTALSLASDLSAKLKELCEALRSS